MARRATIKASTSKAFETRRSWPRKEAVGESATEETKVTSKTEKVATRGSKSWTSEWGRMSASKRETKGMWTSIRSNKYVLIKWGRFTRTPQPG